MGSACEPSQLFDSGPAVLAHHSKTFIKIPDSSFLIRFTCGCRSSTLSRSLSLPPHTCVGCVKKKCVGCVKRKCVLFFLPLLPRTTSSWYFQVSILYCAVTLPAPTGTSIASAVLPYRFVSIYCGFGWWFPLSLSD